MPSLCCECLYLHGRSIEKRISSEMREEAALIPFTLLLNQIIADVPALLIINFKKTQALKG